LHFEFVGGPPAVGALTGQLDYRRASTRDVPLNFNVDGIQGQTHVDQNNTKSMYRVATCCAISAAGYGWLE